MGRLDQVPDRAATLRRILAVRAGVAVARDDALAAEEPMAIRVAGPGQAPIDVAVTMRTPGTDEDLAIGFLVSEGLVAPADIVAVEFADPAEVASPENELCVRLRVAFDAGVIRARTTVASASCGICGTASLDDIERRCAPVSLGPVVAVATVAGLPATLRSGQVTFDRTGGLHAAGLFDPEGRLLRLREDVGRHNAVDKLIGAAARAGELPLAGRLLFVSGRVSFEIVQKAAMAGIPIIAAVSAPTDLAVATAERLGVTLVGFVRDGGCNVYCGEERVSFG